MEFLISESLKEKYKTRIENIENSGIQGLTIKVLDCLNSFELCKYNGNDTHLIIPDEIDSIHGGCFCNCPKLETIHFHEKIEWIPGNNFVNCPNLQLLIFDSDRRVSLEKRDCDQGNFLIYAPNLLLNKLEKYLIPEAVMGFVHNYDKDIVSHDVIASYAKYIKKNKANYSYSIEHDEKFADFCSNENI